MGKNPTARTNFPGLFGAAVKPVDVRCRQEPIPMKPGFDHRGDVPVHRLNFIRSPDASKTAGRKPENSYPATVRALQVAKLTVKLFRNRLATSGSTPERSINGVHGKSEGWPASHSLPLIGARPGVGESPETRSGRLGDDERIKFRRLGGDASSPSQPSAEVRFDSGPVLTPSSHRKR